MRGWLEAKFLSDPLLAGKEISAHAWKRSSHFRSIIPALAPAVCLKLLRSVALLSDTWELPPRPLKIISADVP